jgi:hypothetical protein|uniref:Uncharacterized protein n=2 Tax=Picea TaxID=3328 RepID=A0A117NGP2_PICGL|nr:hypothetical protein ABT39_MTgene6099 [Picea glauca]QHR89936.1 hypothetical protein Q903MT_gene3958 [Picea sitchensis]
MYYATGHHRRSEWVCRLSMDMLSLDGLAWHMALD